MGPSLEERLAVIGVGYVGLPLAVAGARSGMDVVGYDVDPQRVAELSSAVDSTGGFTRAELRASGVVFSSDRQALADRTCFVITVPTPLTSIGQPDLRPLVAACHDVASCLRPGSLVIIESTVYPGATRQLCIPALEASGLECGSDFDLAYSPERVNLGDPIRTIEKVSRVVAGYDQASLTRAGRIYRRIIEAEVHDVASIEVAELAKLVENSQRDLNIAFVNDVAMICDRSGLDTEAVLDAAATKWNFHRYRPGLVGGHCIAVDPHYLLHWARSRGTDPITIHASRQRNESLGMQVADRVLALVGDRGRVPPRVGVLGFSYKSDVPDVRNSGVATLVRQFSGAGARVIVHDPVADGSATAEEFDIKLHAADELADLDVLVVAIAHRVFREWLPGRIRQVVRSDGLVADLTGTVRQTELGPRMRLWRL